MANTYYRYPSAAAASLPSFANAAALPAGYPDGTAAVTLDTDSIYVYDGNTTTWKLVASPGGAYSVGTLDSGTKSADGGHIDSNALIFQTASATFPGLISTGTQTFAGAKTFAALSATTFNGNTILLGTGTLDLATFTLHVTGTASIQGSSSGTNTGDVSLGTASGLSLVGQVLSLGLASAGVTGALSGTDWSTFNSKQAAGNYITALTGDATASGPGSVALTLATVNSNVGSFGSASSVATFTANAKGLITAAASTSIQIAESQVTNLVSDLAGKQATLTIGNLTEATSAVLTITGGTGAIIGSGLSIQVKQAATAQNGYLSSTDWNTFNNKQAAGTYVTSLTVTTGNGVSGSFTAGATPALSLTLGAITPTTVNGNTLTSGTGTLTLSTFTLTVSGTASISGTHTGTSSGTNTGDQTITLTGPITGSGTGSFATSIASQTGTGTTFVMSVAPTLTGAIVLQTLIATLKAPAVNNAVYFSIVNSGGTERGYFGYGGSSSSTLNIQNSENGPIIFGTNATDQVTIAASGAMTIANLAGAGSRAVNASAAGVLSAASDSSLKQEVIEAHIPGLAEILQLVPRAYKWLEDIEIRGENAAIEIGFFADQVAPIIPSAAPKSNDGLYGFYDRSVTAALVKAIQELAAKNDALEARLTALESR